MNKELPSLQFQSFCRPMYIMHCNLELFAIWSNVGTTTNTSSRIEMLKSIEQATINWLLSVDGHISYQTHNTTGSASHDCRVDLLSFSAQVELISAIVLQTILEDYNTTEISSPWQHQHFHFVDQPPGSTTIILHVHCKPHFKLVHNQQSLECFSSIEQEQANEQPLQSSIQSMALSWILSTDTTIYCKQSPQKMTTDCFLEPCSSLSKSSCSVYIPRNISPYLRCIRDEYSNLLTKLSQKAVPESPETCTTTDPTSESNTPTDTPSDSPNQTLLKRKSPSHSPRKAHPVHRQAYHLYPTRARNQEMSKFLKSLSRSKKTIQYCTKEKRRIMPHDPPMLKKVFDKPPYLPIFCPIQTLIWKFDLIALLSVHEKAKSMGIISPRDNWEEWIDASIRKDDRQADRAFMFLMTICMSSSTSDSQLSRVMPRIFSFGITSSRAVIDASDQFGPDAICSMFSEPGRYYQNTERIINAANYFMKHYGGRIPSNITIEELSTLTGIGYKTAAIIVESSFGRSDGIPSDIHVIRWTQFLGWVPKDTGGYLTSKYLESWVHPTDWSSINPMFGSLSQSAVSENRHKLQSIIAESEMSDELKDRVQQLVRKYGSYKQL